MSVESERLSYEAGHANAFEAAETLLCAAEDFLHPEYGPCDGFADGECARCEEVENLAVDEQQPREVKADVRRWMAAHKRLRLACRKVRAETDGTAPERKDGRETG